MNANIELIEAKAFLGSEFLTWLLYRTATREGFTVWEDQEELCTIRIDGPLTLACPYGDASEVTIKGENPVHAPETMKALAEGKRVSRCTLLLESEATEYRLTLNGLTFAIGSLGLLASPGLTEEERNILCVMAAWQAHRWISSAFADFILLRLNGGWDLELQPIRQWIKDQAEIGLSEDSLRSALSERTDLITQAMHNVAARINSEDLGFTATATVVEGHHDPV